VRLVVTDVDGVLTDGGVYYSERGEELKRFDVRDGMGVERLRNAGIATGILTRETSGSVKKRAAKLRLAHAWLGVTDKAAHLATIVEETEVPPDAIAYIGDDVNDLGILRMLAASSLTAAPADARPEVQRVVAHTCAAPGGHGAFRDFAEWILRLRSNARATRA
jgi:3-deoxy-D-manno-octulosonate 8-phosphate phosphatase (KDO 8-P phosphatase)